MQKRSVLRTLLHVRRWGTLHRVRACVLTISSSIAAREREDESGPLAAEFLDQAGHDVAAMEVIPHDLALIEDRLHNYVDEDYALIVTTGGIGPAPEHVTPPARARHRRGAAGR
jgi:molybdopterin biosynthesis enzyme MoaB